MNHAMSVFDLRNIVNAKDKALSVTKPIPEAVKYIHERYGTDLDSASKFVRWLRGIPQEPTPEELQGAKPPPPNKSNTMEKWHLRFDAEKGEWIKLDDPK